MSTEQIIFNTLSDLTGLNVDELQEIRTLNLFENGILNSLSLIRFINELEEQLHCKIDTKRYTIEDYSTIDSLISLAEQL